MGKCRMSAANVVLTRRPKAGRRFEPTWELGLEDQAMAACRSLPRTTQTLTIVREMAGPIGIPDLTALVHDSELLAARLELSVPPLLHEVDAAVAAVAHFRQPRSVATLATALRWPVPTVARRLPALIRCGALIRLKDDRYVRPHALRALGRMYAVESKVKDWRRAVQQGRTYGVWTDSYVLVMGPLTPEVVERVKREVEIDRGGLVVDGRWLVRPAVHGLLAARRLWASEHLVAALVGTELPALVGSVSA
jgi:hypothetical protein